MSSDTTHKQCFSKAIHQIKELVLQNPLLAGEIRKVLAPVYMTVKDIDDLNDKEVGSRKLVDIRSIPCIHGNSGGLAYFVDENCPLCRAYGIENERRADKKTTKMCQKHGLDEVKSESGSKRLRN